MVLPTANYGAPYGMLSTDMPKADAMIATLVPW